MSTTNNNATVNYNALRNQLMTGSSNNNSSAVIITTKRVEVNQRALIDKILARYATASAVYRELLQNSNDAGAVTAEILFETATTTDDNSIIVQQVVYRNNGMPFRSQDWDRLQKIAEGNPDVSKIGAFGVGAYTMFSITEEPAVISGNTCLLFCWQGDALYTKTTTSSTNDTDSTNAEWTTFLLPSRDPYPLPDFTEFGQFLISALTFTASLRNIIVKVNGVEKLHISKTIVQPPRPIQTAATANSTKKSTASFLWDTVTGGGSSSSVTTMTSKTGLFALQASGIRETIVRVTVKVNTAATASMDARYVSGTAKTSINKPFAQRMHRVTKKQPPSTVEIQVFLNYNHHHQQQQDNNAVIVQQNNGDGSNGNISMAQQQAVDIAQSFTPPWSGGRIFIGFRTSQTTGLAAHLAAPFVPTVEREAMDLQDVVLAQFNMELLEISGMLLRLTLEHTMRNVLDAAYQETRAELEAMDQKLQTDLLLAATSQTKNKKVSKKDSKHDEVGYETVMTEEEEDSSSTTSLMSFARFMAKGVKKTIVSVAKSVLEGADGSEQQLLLNPSDPRPLSQIEQQAIVLMQSFCPQQSTPDPAVGTALAEGFSRCMPNSAPPVLTRSGVLPGNEALLPHLGIEAFVSDRVIRKVVYENAEQYHTLIARCRKLYFDDLLNTVSKTILEEEKAVRLVKWWTKFCKVDSPQRSQIRGNKLKEVVRFHPHKLQHDKALSTTKTASSSGPKSAVVVNLSDYLFFVEKNSYYSKRDLPLPETVIPGRLQEAIGYSFMIDDALRDNWFSPLPIEIWAEYISHHGCMNHAKPEDELLRVKVLTVLSQEFMKRSTSDRSVFGDLCRSLLSDKRCIPFDSDQPTQFAAEYPADLYLYSAELKAFHGMGSFHKVAASLQTAGVTDEFLLTLGVRKSVSIDFLFANLDKLNWSQDPKPLVEYLRSATLTNNDFAKLSSSRYLPAANEKSKTYAPGELYLPNDDLRIFPFIKTLHWPSESELSEKSENGKFLVRLGMKPIPSLTTILSYLSNNDLDDEQRLKGLDFVCDRLVPHGVYYSNYNSMGLSEKKKYQFLPCVVNNPLEPDVPSLQRQSPISCFSDVNCGIMGFPVIDPKLGKNGKLYGSLFQCDSEPPANYLLNQLAHLVAVAKKRTGSEAVTADTVRQVETAFTEIFKYLSHRSSDLNYSAVADLKKNNFIPCTVNGKIIWYRPDEVFFKRADRGNDTLTEELFHAIEFSPFLAAAGVRQEATTKDLFQKMIASPKGVLRSLGSEKKYRALLRRVAADLPFALSSPSQEIKNTPFLLAYTVKPLSEEKSDKATTTEDTLTYHLAKAADIFIIDNSNYGRMFPVRRAPPESDLEDFYGMLGSKFISKSVECRFEVVGNPKTDTELTTAFKERLRERGPLLVSPSVTSRHLVSGAASILDETRLEFYETTNLLAVYTLGKTSRRDRVTCCSREIGRNKNRIYLTEDLDFFDAGMAIGSLILKRCQLEDAFFISSLLEAPLDQLRARGFPVDRILRPEPVVVPEEAPTPAAAAKNTSSYGGNTVAAIPLEPSADVPSADTGSKADILKQMFPDADPDFIEAALGLSPSVDDVRELAEKMANGHYPTLDNKSSAGNVPMNGGLAGESLSDSPPSPSPKKKSGLRKRLGRAFGGKRASNFGGAQLPNIGQNLGGGHGHGTFTAPGPSSSTEHRAPVSPASDAHTQSSLERMLENSVGTATEVQKNGIESPETTLTSIPQELDRGETCEVLAGQSLKPFLGPRGTGKTHNGIVVFSSKIHSSSEEFLVCNEVSLGLFADVLERLCVDVYGLKLSSVAIYHDPAGNTIAFNSNRSLHFNFRFFHALHFLQNKHASSECYSYWFMTIAHELSHNFVSGHSREHGFYTESFSTHYLPKLVVLLQSLDLR